MFWPGDRTTDHILSLDYWYNSIDHLNFAYSYKMSSNFAKKKRKKEICKTFYSLTYSYSSLCEANDSNNARISL